MIKQLSTLAPLYVHIVRLSASSQVTGLFAVAHAKVKINERMKAKKRAKKSNRVIWRVVRRIFLILSNYFLQNCFNFKFKTKMIIYMQVKKIT